MSRIVDRPVARFDRCRDIDRREAWPSILRPETRDDMETKRAAKLLGALAHPVRMDAVRALARAGQAGMTQGSLADTAGIGPTTLAFHLKELIAADLVSHSRKGRSAVYFIQQAGWNERSLTWRQTAAQVL